MKKQVHRGHFLSLACAAFGIPRTLLTRQVIGSITMAQLAFWRFLLGGGLLILTQRKKAWPKPERGDILLLVISGGLLGSLLCFYYVTLEKLSVALALFLSYLGPFWITLASWRKRRSLPQLELIAVGLILIGESTLLGSETAFRAISWSGVGIALLASIVQAAFISASAHLSQRSKLPVHVLATYQQLIAAIAVWIFAQHFALGLIPAWRPKALLFLLVMSVTLGAAFFPLAFLAQRLTRIVEYALWQTLDPLLATYFVGWLWYHEGSGPFGLIGILLATAGAMLNAYTQQGQNRSP